MEALIGIADRGPRRVVEPKQCAVDLDAVPGRLQIETTQEADLRSEFAPDAPVCRALRFEVHTPFARGGKSSRRVCVVAQQGVRRAGKTEPTSCAPTCETRGEQLGR